MEDNNTLVLEHMGLAERIAARKKSKVPTSVSYDDLKSAAYLGLVDAATKYDRDNGTPFEVYAGLRITGAIKDYLRECGWGPRDNRVVMASLDAPTDQDGGNLAATLEAPAVIRAGDLFEKLTGTLPSLAKSAIRMYYVDGLKMREIATRLGLTEGRISQIVSQSKGAMRSEWEDREDDLWGEVA